MPTGNNRCYKLWIDGVGAWQLCAGRSFSIGAPSEEQPSADIALLANISRRHATLNYAAESWHVTAHQPTRISGTDVDLSASTVLRSGDELALAERVRLGFRIPSVLSSSAVVDFESNHRPTHTVDGIILMVDHCLLGPRRDHHVCCRDWPDVVVLYTENDELCCRSTLPLEVNGVAVTDGTTLATGAVVTSGDDLRFRVEEVR